MKYIVCEEPGHFKLKEKAIPKRKKGAALLRITRVGICGTDLHAYQGNQPFFSYPRILGHELAAEVVEIESNEQGIKVGDAVIIMPYLSCGTCIACRRGKTNCCTKLEVLGVHTDGGMQEMITVPVDLLLPSGNLSPEAIAIVEPLCIGAHCISRAQIEPGETVLVIGCGPIGIGVMKQAQLAGAKVIAMDVNVERLAFVQNEIGIPFTVNALDHPTEAILAINNNDLPTIVIDATGNKRALETGVEYMAHGGKYLLVGVSKANLTFSNPYIQSKETTLLCSRNATKEDFYKVKEILESGAFPISAYITHTIPFTEMIEHFDAWIKPETRVIKAMLTFE